MVMMPWLVILGLAVSVTSGGGAAETKPLWQIGELDHNDVEFALAPKDYGQFKEDGLFVVGESETLRDWPYVHPGPDDTWAGGRPHAFVVLFGLKKTGGEGECRLTFDLLDTHAQRPPTLRIEVNGQSFEQALPKGAGDESIRGRPEKGTEYCFAIPFTATSLRLGDNEIRITTLTGSWFIYDRVALEAPAGTELAAIQSRSVVDLVRPVRGWVEKGGVLFQPVRVTVRHFGEDAQGVLRVEGAEAQPVRLVRGEQTVEAWVPAVPAEVSRQVSLEVPGQGLVERSVTLKPVRKLTVYILPHSHTDIGYTEIQTAVEDKQVNNLVQGIEYARHTASYPEGARFVWNVEVGWAADLYLRRLNERQRGDFFEAVKKGQVALDGMYLNELTGLCRPEELVRLFRFATELTARTGVPIDSAMISDVPGYTWGTVTAMRHAGIKYFSAAPNYSDRIGTILREWENKPFYWIGPDGRSKVLVWIPFWGYAMSHRYGKMSDKLLEDLCDGLEARAYPYDIACVRWSGHGDNAVPDPAICEFVKEWNAVYTWPRFIISRTSVPFQALEHRYGDKLPQVRGDWTPYWEDGAGSSAFETGLNRASSDRLAQAETLMAMRDSSAYPSAVFEEAWDNVLLYSEHTWGAWCSVSEPERKETREQWEIKKSYADQADRQSKELLDRAMSSGQAVAGPSSAVDVLNTLSWPRTEPVVVAASLSTAGDRVVDDQGRPVPSQRLSSGELVFLAQDIPPLAARRYCLVAGAPHVGGKAIAAGTVLDSGALRVRVDETTGGIVDLTGKGLKGNFADTSGGEALNDYLYLQGDDLRELRRSGPATIAVGEAGPLVASLVIESGAPGCRKLRRELRVVAGMGYVEVVNLVDKARLEARSYQAKEGKESVNFAFPFNVPGGEMRLDVPFGVMRPEADQIPSACKNWFTVGRWADISNRDLGVTWVTLDAPLVEVGGITATLLNSQTDPNVWRHRVDRTQTLYSWAMNNHWHTNYRAYQEGPTLFRFILRPHRRYDPSESSRFATGFSQPLLACRPSPVWWTTPLLQVTPSAVLVLAVKPSDDGRAWIVRLFGASGEAHVATLRWGQRKPRAVFLSDTSEKQGERMAGPVSVSGYELVTLRAELQ